MMHYFKEPLAIGEADVEHLMNAGKFTFVIDIPPNFQRDVLAGRQGGLQINVDATAMVQAGLGSGYAQQIISTEIAQFLSHAESTPLSPVNLAIRIAFNPNIETAWFSSVMGIISSVTILAIILAGAALVREREHGTMDHLMVIPLSPFEITMSKIWANGFVIAVAVDLSLYLVVRLLLKIPIAGSIPLFMFGTVLYLFFATAIGLFLGTVARSMPQLGLLYMLVAVPMNVLSGNATARKHAALACNHHAGFTLDPLRLLRPGDPLSRRRPRRGVAAISRRRRHCLPFSGVVAFPLPFRAKLGVVLRPFLI